MGKKGKVVAVIPAYNEAKRIGEVINNVKKSKLINEIIVVDDGSRDGTYDAVKNYKGVKCIRHEKNKGKGVAVDTGIKSTNANIIFLCDADLKKFTPEMIDEIILPVLEGDTKMNLGVRNFFSYRFFKKHNLCSPFLFISGQRAFVRKIWTSLPPFYKKGYRIEIGMNCLANYNFDGFTYSILDYGQVTKEKKSGIIKGEIQRWKMMSNLVHTFFVFKLGAFLRKLNLKSSF